MFIINSDLFSFCVLITNLPGNLVSHQTVFGVPAPTYINSSILVTYLSYIFISSIGLVISLIGCILSVGLVTSSISCILSVGLVTT